MYKINEKQFNEMPQELKILYEKLPNHSSDEVVSKFPDTKPSKLGKGNGDHFVEVTKMVPLGSGSEREVEDIMLTRYACYLIAQNGNSRKEEIAFAQTYFAIQTRKQELIEERIKLKERFDVVPYHLNEFLIILSYTKVQENSIIRRLPV